MVPIIVPQAQPLANSKFEVQRSHIFNTIFPLCCLLSNARYASSTSERGNSRGGATGARERMTSRQRSTACAQGNGHAAWF